MSALKANFFIRRAVLGVHLHDEPQRLYALPRFPYHQRHIRLREMDAEEDAALVLGAVEAHVLGLEHDAAEELPQECFVRSHAGIVPRDEPCGVEPQPPRISRPCYEAC